MIEEITIEEFHRRMETQGVSSLDHFAFVCPICGTPQSMASLIRAGAPPEKVGKYIGFSCEGRFTDVGPWPGAKLMTAKAKARRLQRGCDFTLGGLFSLHKIEVITDKGLQPFFEIASSEVAKALEAAAPEPMGE